MQPVVNRLQTEFKEEIEFRNIDANTSSGMELFKYFSLQGHPSYVLINPDGEILWQSLGEQQEEKIKNDIVIILRQ
jgi:hypothetical protein